jgi:hypothetical protein
MLRLKLRFVTILINQFKIKAILFFQPAVFNFLNVLILHTILLVYSVRNDRQGWLWLPLSIALQ